MISVEVIRCLKTTATSKQKSFSISFYSYRPVFHELPSKLVGWSRIFPIGNFDNTDLASPLQTALLIPMIPNYIQSLPLELLVSAMLVGKSQGITKVHYLPKICREKFCCINHQNGRLVTWFQLRMRTRPCVPFVSILRIGVSWLSIKRMYKQKDRYSLYWSKSVDVDSMQCKNPSSVVMTSNETIQG